MLKKAKLLLLLIASGALVAGAAGAAYEPWSLLLTWQRDPATTMTVDWHSRAEDRERNPVLEYREKGAGDWRSVTGERMEFPFTNRFFDRVELTDLAPDSAYEFRFGADSPVYYFRTMPEQLDRPLRFATGGDTRHNQEWMEQTNRVAMEYDPEFIVWGGDLAYADGLEERAYRWYEWFDAVKHTLVAEDGRVVPILCAIGNHEVRGGYYNRNDRSPRPGQDWDAFQLEIAPYYFTLMAFPGHPGYGVLDFGDYLSLILLDTDHAGPIAGGQTEWLEGVLKERAERPHVFPVYHVPAYPSVRDFEARRSTAIRENWAPLFERYGVRVAFENHDHAYKRTVPITGGKHDPDDGMVFFGDGAWGVGVRDTHDVEETWYLEKAESKRHAIIVTLDGDSREFLVVDEDGEVIDEFAQPGS